MKYYEILYNFSNIYVYSRTLCITLCIEGYTTDCDHSDTRYHVTLHSCKMVFRVSYYKKKTLLKLLKRLVLLLVALAKYIKSIVETLSEKSLTLTLSASNLFLNLFAEQTYRASTYD